MTSVGYRRILLGFDGSDQAADALALTRLLAGPTGARVQIACAYPYQPLGPTAEPVGEFADAVREEAERALAAARAGLGDRAGTVETRLVADSSPARALQHLAEDEDADLVVVGSTHRGRVGRVLIGAVPDRLLHGAPCAVAVAPLGFRDRAPAELRTIGVGIDDSAEAALALDAAAALTGATGARLRIATATGPPAGSPEVHVGYDHVVVMRALRAQAEQRVAEAARGLAGTEADTAVLEGDAAATLLDLAENLDLLVVGSRAYGPLARTLLGSVSQALVHDAPCPVLVVPRGIAQAPRSER